MIFWSSYGEVRISKERDRIHSAAISSNSHVFILESICLHQQRWSICLQLISSADSIRWEILNIQRSFWILNAQKSFQRIYIEYADLGGEAFKKGSWSWWEFFVLKTSLGLPKKTGVWLKWFQTVPNTWDATRITIQAALWYQLAEEHGGEILGQASSGLPSRRVSLRATPAFPWKATCPGHRCWLTVELSASRWPWFIFLVSHSLHVMTQWHFLLPFSF